MNGKGAFVFETQTIRRCEPCLVQWQGTDDSTCWSCGAVGTRGWPVVCTPSEQSYPTPDDLIFTGT